MATFEDVTLASGIAKASLPWTGWSNVVADFNNDGWKDLFSANGHVMDNAELSSGRAVDAAQSSAHEWQNLFLGRTLAGRGAPPRAGVGRFRSRRARGSRGHAAQSACRSYCGIAPRAPVIGSNSICAAQNPTGMRSERGWRWRPADGKQWDRVAGWSGYGCSSSHRLHFGIGAAAALTRIAVRWPAGSLTELRDVPARQILEVREKPD